MVMDRSSTQVKPSRLDGVVPNQFDDEGVMPDEEPAEEPAVQRRQDLTSMLFDMAPRESVVVENESSESESEGEMDGMESSLLREGGATKTGVGATGLKQMAAKMDTAPRHSHLVVNSISKAEKAGATRSRHTGRDDRATSEQVMDPRTRLVLFKLLNKGFLQRIEGCLSTGKEANVYYAVGSGGQEYAAKIYKTSIMVFKDRDKYVSGEYRYRHGYCRSNPRKMVKVWAEKEMRNLRRLQAAGIPSPSPVLIKSNVLIMDFLGKEGWPSPRLRDISLSRRRMSLLYEQCVTHMRTMFHKCKLVHGDLSEYNLLLHEGKLIFIDVSQSMEHDHPRAMDFLRMDCKNVTDFFRRKGCLVMGMRRLYEFVSGDGLPEGQEGARIAALVAEAQGEELTSEEQVQEAVFMSSFIPRNLHEVEHIEREAKAIAGGETTAHAIAISHMLKPDPGEEEAIVEAVQPEGEKNETGKLRAGSLGEGYENPGRGSNGSIDEGTSPEDEMGSGSESDSDWEDERPRKPGNYSTMTPEERGAAKAAAKVARKLAKEDQKEKRKTKLKK
ncbi:unnamed protein product, partial [Chrysoparadoxa australica]